jgi:hypothetical protein
MAKQTKENGKGMEGQGVSPWSFFLTLSLTLTLRGVDVFFLPHRD